MSETDGTNWRNERQVACFTEEDWRRLCDSLASATSKNEKVLYRTLKEDFLPEIPNLFAEKERQQRKRLSDVAPRRASTRLEKLKIQREEQERIVAVAIQAELLHATGGGSDSAAAGGSEEAADASETATGHSTDASRSKKSKKIDEGEWFVFFD